MIGYGSVPEPAITPGVREIAVFTAASETFNRKNIHAGVDESIERFRPVVTRALEEKVRVRGYVSNSFGDVQVLKPAPVDLITGAVPVGSLPTGVAVSPPMSNPRAWTVTAPMPTPRARLAAATAVGADGRSRIYAIGGQNDGNTALSTVEAYDPQSDS